MEIWKFEQITPQKCQIKQKTFKFTPFLRRHFYTRPRPHIHTICIHVNRNYTQAQDSKY